MKQDPEIKKRLPDDKSIAVEEESPLKRIKRRRTEHVEEVRLMMCKYKTEISDETLQNAQIDSDVFWDTLQKICMKWMGMNAPIGDVQGKRFIYKVIQEKLKNPLTIATIGNSVNAFSRNSMASLEPSVKYWLDLACLCGSELIVNHILNNYKYNVADLENAIEYAVSSENESLALRVAKLAKQLGKKDPGLIYIYSFDASLAEQVGKLFSDKPLKEQGYYYQCI